MKQIRIYGLLLLLLMSMMVWGQELSVAERNAAQGFNDTIDRLAPDFVQVSLVVCEPYEVLYSTLGHAALHLQCRVFDLDYVYTYESENVLDKIWTFLKGDLKMGLYAVPTPLFLNGYRATGRGVKEYTMNLTPAQKQKLWEVMDHQVEEGANLPYDYFKRGCAKSVVHVIHEALGRDAIHYAPWPDKYTKQTQRELVRNFITGAPWEEFLMYFLIGVEGDKPCSCEKKLIVPTDLVEVWQQATFSSGKPVLESEPRILLETTRRNQGTWCTPLLISILLLLLALVSMTSILTKNKVYRITGNVLDYTLLTVTTFAGMVMTYLIVFSGLPCTDWNWLIIPFNVLPALCWYWRKYWALPYAIVILIWCLIMTCVYICWHVLVDIPHMLFALAFACVLVKQWLIYRLR